MSSNEKLRLENTLGSIATSNLDGLPKYIVDSVNEGLSLLSVKLIETGFLKNY
jgi:hypothetical protein